jgi:hypothetical protein
VFVLIIVIGSVAELVVVVEYDIIDMDKSNGR